MELFHRLFADYPILSLLQVAFTIWMLVDAYRRQAEGFWFWVILFIPLLGAVTYFFVYKVHDLPHLPALSWFQSRASLNELRYRANQVPTLASHLALAERLVERREFEEAITHLEEARKREPEHGQVLYMLAVCHKERGEPGQAVPLLETVLRKDRRFSDYAAWEMLIETRALGGDRAGALESCRELERLSPTLRHRCLLAEYLLAERKAEEANRLLDKALLEHAYLPGYLRRRNYRWARHARSLQKRAANS
jgi:hypothetical protein